MRKSKQRNSRGGPALTPTELWAAKLISAARAKMDITQVELASILGCSQPLISRIDNLSTSPNLALWITFAIALDISIDTFALGTAKADPFAAIHHLKAEEIRQRLTRAFKESGAQA